MKVSKVCTCTSKRRCDPCAERDLSALLAKVRQDKHYIREERMRESITIDPRPEAREKAFHRHGMRGTKIDTDPIVTRDPNEGEMRHISERIRKACDRLASEMDDPAWRPRSESEDDGVKLAAPKPVRKAKPAPEPEPEPTPEPEATLEEVESWFAGEDSE